MNATTKVKLRDISPSISCNLCRGYMIDATTTIECLHSFCKSCIVKHLENSEYCPVCDVQLHSTKPLCGIRSDQMLQEIIYKLVPGLYTREMERRRKFYKENPKSVPTSRMDSGKISQQPYITSDDKINISLEYFTDDKNIQDISRKYLQSPAGASVFVLRQWVQGKHELPKDTKIEILYGDRILPQDFLLMDIAYKYSWTESMTKPLQLRYRITGSPLLSSILTNLESPPLVKVTQPSKRKSRSLTDSEVLKSSSNVNSLTLIPTPPNKIPKITPKEAKIRGRKKRSSINLVNNDFATADDSPREKVDAKIRKRINNNNAEKTMHFKDMESQCVSHDAGSGYTPQKEVQLQISESGVISAKSVASGEEKIIIGQSDGSLETNLIPHATNAAPSSQLESTTKPQNINNNRPNFSYVQLNIPTINGLSSSSSGTTPIINPTVNSNAIHPPAAGKLSSRNKAGDISLLPKPTQLLTPKKLLEQMGIHSGANMAKNMDPNSYESKKANMQKAIKDLQRKHVDNGTTTTTSSLSKSGKNNKQGMTNGNKGCGMNKNGEKSSSILSPGLVNGIQSAVTAAAANPPLPFPLSALASSGMTVNLIPSSELLKQTNSFVKGKDIDSSSPPPSKKLKHTTTLQNGEIRFTSPRQILPSTSNGVAATTTHCSTSSSESSPTKPRKFFKSRHSPDHNGGINSCSPVKVGGGEKQPKSPQITSSKSIHNGKKNNGIMAQQLSPTTDLKLINSTSCKTSNTMTTSSRLLSTPTTTAVPQSNSQQLHQQQQYSPSAISQIMQYWNSLQFQLPNLAGIPQMNFLPVMNKDLYNSMTYNLNPTNRSINDSLSTLSSFPQNPSYSMIYTPNQFGLSNGIHQNNNTNNVKINGGDSITPSTTTFSQNAQQATDLSLSSLKKNGGGNELKNKVTKGGAGDAKNNNTLDLSVNKKSPKVSSNKGDKISSPDGKKGLKSKSNNSKTSNSNSIEKILSSSSPPPHPPKSTINESIENQAAQTTVTSNGINSSDIMSPAPLYTSSALSVVKNGSNSDSGMDSLSSTSEPCDKELADADFHIQNQSSQDQEMVVVDNNNSSNVEPQPQPLLNGESEPNHSGTLSLDVKPNGTLENGRFSPEASNDSTDLVINEDCEMESSSTSPHPPSETNNVEPNDSESKIIEENSSTNETQDKVDKDLVPASPQITNGIQDDQVSISTSIVENGSTSSSDNLIKDSPVCNNNNNDLHPPASADLNIQNGKQLVAPPEVPN